MSGRVGAVDTALAVAAVFAIGAGLAIVVVVALLSTEDQ